VREELKREEMWRKNMEDEILKMVEEI